MLSASKIVIRTPFHPFTLYHLSESFKGQLHSSIFKEALFLGSPNLYEEFEKAGELISEETRLSLYKYFLRMSYRCTPFGMFSGVSAGTIGNSTCFTLPAQSSYCKHTRTDNHFINTFIHKILKDQAIKTTVSWYANNTFYRNGNTIRYVEYRLTNSQRSHHLTKVETSTYLDIILKKAKDGAKFKELTASILSNEITEEDAIAFIDELIESRLLLSELEPVVTGQEPDKSLLKILEKYESGKSYALFLEKTMEQIHSIETQPPGTEIGHYKKVLKLVKEWDDMYDPKLIFQSDLSKPSAHMQMSARVLDELKDAISFLAILNGPIVHSNLSKFKEEFTKRYEDSEVPLLEVLDTESGIGYPPGAHANNDQAPLLQGLHFNLTTPVTEYRVSSWHRKLVHLYQQCVAQGKTELTITDDTFSIDRKLFNKNVLPDSMSTICSVLATDEELKSDQFTIDYRGSSGPSAANLLGRFCYLDPEIQAIVAELIEQEEKQHPDKIFAEIVHLAQARIGNVLIRPALRKYEIPILTFSAFDRDHAIGLDDIMVSVKFNRIILRTKRLNKEIVPRNTTAHNYANDTVPHYYFLCELQYQDNRSRLTWDWGMLKEFKFLPRVKYGKVVLSKARWIIDSSELGVSSKQSASDFKLEIERYQIDNYIPRFVVLAQGDNQLPLDLGDDMCLKIAKQELIRNKSITLEECLFNDKNLAVEGPEGKFTNEIIVPWAKTKEEVIQSSALQNPSGRLKFVPGSSWHYIKIYCGAKTSDSILIDVIKPMADELLMAGHISHWFFIRYADPDYHIRIRFKGEGNYFSIVTENLNQRLASFISNGMVWKIQIDTYQPELDRYGYDNMENSEQLFFYDSAATVEILKLLEGDEGDELRWQFAIKGVNDLLNDFSLSLDEKEKFMISMRDVFKREFNAVDRGSQQQLSEHFRKYRKELELVLQLDLAENHDFYAVWAIYNKRTIDWHTTVEKIRQYVTSNATTHSLTDLLSSYVHMFINRFIRSNQRLHELVIYDFLCQYYRSALARKKKDKNVISVSN
jgi:lantibiotic biosynthesis protein